MNINLTQTNIAPLGQGSDSPKLINKLTDDVFKLTDNVSGKVKDLDVAFPDANNYWRIWARQLVINVCGGYVSPNTQALSARFTTVSIELLKIKKLTAWATSHHPDKPLTQWGEPECTAYVNALAFNKIDVAMHERFKEKELLAFGTIDNNLILLKATGTYYRKGFLNDGLLAHLPKDFTQMVLKQQVIDMGVDYVAWLKGGSYGRFPLEISMLLLSEAIEILRSPSTHLLQAYFRAQRGEFKLHPESVVFNGNAGSEPRLKLYLEGKALSKFQGLNQNLNNTIPHFANKVEEEYAKLQGLDKPLPLSDIFTLKGVKHVNELCLEVYDACIIVFLCLTGIRIHELSNVDADDYDIQVDGTWMFRTDINKTHFGCSEMRSMSGLVAEAAMILNDLSYVTKRDLPDEESTPLFGQYFKAAHFDTAPSAIKSKKLGISTNAMRNHIQKFYETLIEKHGEHLRKICENINPHGFRHCFSEFAIRRFDGDVLEAIRQHFRHRVGSSFTRAYTDDKGFDDIRQGAEHRYIKELLHRMVGEDAGDFTGAMALHVRREVNKMAFRTPGELDEFLNDLSNDFDSLKPHEFGFCLVLTETRHLSKCLDKKTGVPNLLDGCFELCSGCHHSFRSKKSNYDSVLRNVLSHEDFLERFPLRSSQHFKVSEQVVERGNKILDAME
ncbi:MULTISPECIES: site-specific integrase [unclassified Colwellia]|jgi:integrase|uniref:site-specific integrase n=1 Tax=unclassified Colwellia TaxID=196834 RepID=UPI0015F4BEBD|nr:MULTISPECIES: site-specific integrase [unclassified Colwellia]MBA6232405.1 site-specific integrase [Colwellia sp. MB02u-7]MBA6238262.1 site-specific integrase [Colwellia sp. MB02u-11]MBA6301012.1 site-specific integrase [Colwellia sp. MB3u-22]MBA6310056.1 site-specific integrase [Colwellia sp. MB3u-64]